MNRNGSYDAMTAQSSANLADIAEWFRIEREKIGNVDGYDYRSGEEFGLRRGQIEIERRLVIGAEDRN